MYIQIYFRKIKCDQIKQRIIFLLSEEEGQSQAPLYSTPLAFESTVAGTLCIYTYLP